ncbi:alkaline phosphatase D family protein [Streptomyces sp. 8K308]|uniref:alkaline phosphatase D family protein n=1 Tax=Streptomyces sp. 8K308 TaxID=2530388 RepID=UPI002442685E|nr:alkaline phosphatase D family protein [Streptomyces sp. 8K308]
MTAGRRPQPDGFVIWTRPAPDPLAPGGGGGMPQRPVPVEWRVATDERMRHVVRRGTVAALPELAHSVHEFSVLDGRQYRSVPPAGWGESPASEASYDPSVTMLGERQERWLLDGPADSRARWNVLANNVMMGRLDHDGPSGDVLWHDAWDGFPAARTRVTDRLVGPEVRNPVVITGDWHSTVVNDIRRDFDDPDSPVVATEFVGTSISTNGDGEVYGPYYGPMIRHNPHIRFFAGDRRGYVRCTVERDEWRTDLRMVPTVGRPDVTAYTHASFVVENGRPGARQV